MPIRKVLQHTRRPDLSFLESGRVDITSRVVRLLDIHPGDVLSIVIVKGEWYLYVANRAESLVGRHEAQCFPTKKGSRNFRLWSRSLASAVLTECGGVSRADLPAGEVSDVLGFPTVPIITQNNLSNEQRN